MYEIKNNECFENVIKKSRFIALTFKVNNVLKVPDIIKNVKEEYKGATHFPFAYHIGPAQKLSDDGEPGGCAGAPILNVINKNKLDNILIIVVRYFGGIKLGAGGLLRAYSNTASSLVKKSETIKINKIINVRIEFSYDALETINHILTGYDITYKEFDKNIIYEFLCNKENYPKEIELYIIKKAILN